MNDIIYFAGYTDGDGCFSITKNVNKFRSSFVITSTNYDLVSHLISTYHGYMRTNNNKDRPNHKICFHFIKNRKEAAAFARHLLPYLVEKVVQCNLFISFFETKSNKTKLEIINNLKKEKSEKNLVTLFDFHALKTIKKNINPVKTDFIYLAGFIDAECHLGIQHYKPKNRPNEVFKIVIQCNNTKSPIFYWLKNRFGGSCHFIDRKSKVTTRSNQILWKLTGRSVFILLKNTIQFLRYKKPVAEKIIEFYETTLGNGGARHTKEFRDSYKKILTIRQDIVSQVHNLNQKGLLNV